MIEYSEVEESTEAMRDSINGIPSGGVSGPIPSVTGDNVPEGKLPSNSGAPNPRGKGGSNPAPSKFENKIAIPQIKMKPIKHPEDHKHDESCAATGSHVVSAEFCLEQTARVLMDLAEQQEDPAWVESHRTLAEQWMQMAQILLTFRIDAQQNTGEIEMKQQQMNQQDEVHRQSLAQNDQLHKQSMQHNDNANKQTLTQNDQKHSFRMDTASAAQKVKTDAAAAQKKETTSPKPTSKVVK